MAGDIHFSGQLLHASDRGVKRPAVLGGSRVKRHAILSGTAVLDDRGVAEVRLDSGEALEFATERYDVTYSLTAVGAAMPHLHVSAELGVLHDGQALAFSIAGGAPSKKVSWQIGLASLPVC